MKKTAGIIAAVVIVALVGGVGYMFGTTRGGGAQAAQITKEEAQAIALKDAGIAEADTTRLSVKYDGDDRTPNYDITFYNAAQATEYEYEIDATTGAITSVETNILKTTTGANTASEKAAATGQNAAVSMERAKQIALENAGVNEVDIANLNIYGEEDDGIAVWNVDFDTATKEYDYEISQTDGSIVKNEVEDKNND